MKGYPRPLSEAFVYGSPERPLAGSFRWVSQERAPARKSPQRRREVPHAGRTPQE